MHMTLLWMLALPIFGGLGLYAWMKTENTDTPWFAPILAALPGMAVVGLVFALSYGGAVMDTEVWSGQITGKTRVHDTYEESYECNCTTDSKGNRSCSTCYRTHYTVKWDAQSTIGTFHIDSKDSTWRSVYQTPDPARYTTVAVGDPCSDTHAYTNYVQAVPSSLFSAAPKDLHVRFANMLPKYPDQIYDLYKINRFVQVGFNFTDSAQWNQDIAMMLRVLGPKKQANVIVVVAKTTDTDYEYALRDAWEGVNKNDIVLLIASENGRDIAYTRVLSWTKNEIFRVELNDRIREIGVIDRTRIMPALEAQIAKNFERRHMAEFAYLKGEIDPPMWLILTTILLLVIGYTGGPVLHNMGKINLVRRPRGRW